MKIFRNLKPFKTYVLVGDGKHNDTEALQALMDGEVVFDDKGNKIQADKIIGKTFLVTDTIHVRTNEKIYPLICFINCVFNFHITGNAFQIKPM